jgi:hypothetical protein
VQQNGSMFHTREEDRSMEGTDRQDSLKILIFK